MNTSPHGVWSDIQAIKRNSPLIHNITNFVVMESTANGLLAIGASPVMAHAAEEVQDMVAMASGLVLNIGTLSPSWIHAMMLALKEANTKKIPVVFDPVGVGATPFRAESARSLLHHGRVTAIRGNASEIASLAGSDVASKGVDSIASAHDCHAQAKAVASKHNCIVWMSGKTVVITDGQNTILIHNGHPFMSQVTGMGCLATAITGAFLAVNQEGIVACAHAAACMGVVGEIAAEHSKGPGSFKSEFLDALYSVSIDQLQKRTRLEYL